MRWLRSNGLILEVRQVGPVVLALQAPKGSGAPLPCFDYVVDDAAAREVITSLIASGAYERLAPEVKPPARPARDVITSYFKVAAEHANDFIKTLEAEGYQIVAGETDG